MVYLHNVGYVHNDLTSKNVLLDKELIPRVGDFGQSLSIHDKHKQDNTAALPWCAPEILNGQEFSQQGDIYSMGVILWELWSQTSPINFQGMSPYKIAHAVAEEDFRFPIPDNCPSYIKTVVLSCWQDSPFRPSFHSLIKDLKMAQFRTG